MSVTEWQIWEATIIIIKSTVNTQAGCLIFLLTCEILFRLGKLFSYSKHKNGFNIKEYYEIGPCR